jgi:hypothetical protein
MQNQKISWTQYALVGGLIAVNVAIIYGLVRLTPLGDGLKDWESRTFTADKLEEVKDTVRKVRDGVVDTVKGVEKQVAA